MNEILILFSIYLSIYLCSAQLQCNGTHEFLWEYTPVCPLECATLRLNRCMGVTNTPSCQCKDGTIRDTKSGKCVPINECPNEDYYDSTALKCSGENEIFSEVVSACPTTCNHPTGPLCAAIIKKPSCICAERTVRDTVNNKCVPKDLCPNATINNNSKEKVPEVVCNGLNEEYKEWVSACPSVCPHTALPLPPENCKALIQKPSCVCTNGTIRDTNNNKCVNALQCPQIEEPINTNSEMSECNGLNEEQIPITKCQPSCQSPRAPLCLVIVDKPSCVCKTGTIRDSISGKCVQINDCPKVKSETNELLCEAQNEVLSPVTTCHPSCQTPYGPLCDSIVEKPSCVCKSGTIRDSVSGKCVEWKDCPKNTYQ